VIATDAGSAPNYDAPCVTLAICKPRIRLSAQPGDLVLAFNGSTLHPNPHSVRWAGIVSEKLSFTDYWADQRFQAKKPACNTRPDNIYKPAGLKFQQVTNPVHGPEALSKDISGRYVLTFDTHWYFGSKAPELPGEFGLRMDGGRRGHRVTDLDEPTWVALRAWLNDQPIDIVVRPDKKPTSCSTVRTPSRRC